MNGMERLAQIVREERDARGLTQSRLAARCGVSVDSIRRIERGRSSLPVRHRDDRNTLDKTLTGLGLDVCEVMRTCFSSEELAASSYKRCLAAAAPPARQPNDASAQVPSLQEYIDQVPTTKASLLGQAAMLNAQAMAFLISLERVFDKFEFLVTNQPPFVLFADDEYITQGSSSTELDPVDRTTYHQMIFAHRERMRLKVRNGEKHYKVVLHKDPLIEFLAHRSRDRAVRIVADVRHFLRFKCFDMVILDQSQESDEFEVLAGHYPYSHVASNDAVSVRHRRIGIGNTMLYQLSLIGTDDQLVAEDHARAEEMWRRGLAELDSFPASYADFRRGEYALKRERIVARALGDALEAAHPSALP